MAPLLDKEGPGVVDFVLEPYIITAVSATAGLSAAMPGHVTFPIDKAAVVLFYYVSADHEKNQSYQ
jgi:hypothetical protein